MFKHVFLALGLTLTIALALCILTLQAMAGYQRDEGRDASLFEMLVEQVLQPGSARTTSPAEVPVGKAGV